MNVVTVWIRAMLPDDYDYYCRQIQDEEEEYYHDLETITKQKPLLAECQTMIRSAKKIDVAIGGVKNVCS